MIFAGARNTLNPTYLDRAMGVYMGIFINVAQQSAYFSLPVDADGNPFEGGKYNYTLEMSKDQIPPVKNCYIESFNGRRRDECLNQSWFLSLSEAQEQLDALRKDYNETRPHSSLGDLPPAIYVQLLQEVAAT